MFVLPDRRRRIYWLKVARRNNGCEHADYQKESLGPGPLPERDQAGTNTSVVHCFSLVETDVVQEAPERWRSAFRY
jgi:hypothetical protein